MTDALFYFLQKHQTEKKVFKNKKTQICHYLQTS